MIISVAGVETPKKKDLVRHISQMYKITPWHPNNLEDIEEALITDKGKSILFSTSPLDFAVSSIMESKLVFENQTKHFIEYALCIYKAQTHQIILPAVEYGCGNLKNKYYSWAWDGVLERFNRTMIPGDYRVKRIILTGVDEKQMHYQLAKEMSNIVVTSKMP